MKEVVTGSLPRIWRKATAVGAALALAVGGLTVVQTTTATPAQAARYYLKVTKLTAHSKVIARQRDCKTSFTFAAHSNLPRYDLNFVLAGSDNGGYDHTAWGASKQNKPIWIDACPTWESDLGRRYIRATYYSGWTTSWQPLLDGVQKPTGKTQAKYYVRAKSKARFSAQRSGKAVRLTIMPTRYNPGRLSGYDLKRHGAGWKKYSPKRVKFQIKTGKKWKTLKSVNVKHGKKTVTLSKKAKARYRVVIRTTNVTKGVTTKSVRR